MFIPIHAKADIVGEKKGKITPAQASQLNAWCLASKTGILDIYNNTTKEYERCEATATSYSISNNVATIVLNKGYIVICGRLVEVEKNTRIDIDTSANPSGKIILSFNLSSSGREEFKVEVVNRNLRQYDLNENPISGVYEFELYSYSTTGSTLTLTRSNNNYIPDIGGKLNNVTKEIQSTITGVKKEIQSNITGITGTITGITGTGVVGNGNPPLQAYNKSKGTIEERLTRLGFKEGAVILPSGVTASVNKLKRQGNYVIGEVVFNDNFTLQGGTTHLFDLPVGFRPKENITFGDSYGMYGAREYTISTNGKAQVAVSNVAYRKLHLNFGFEAPPIN